MNRILSILASITLVSATQLQAQSWLPKGSVVCFRSQFEDGFLGDGTYKLKAKITKAQFDSIVKALGATPHTKKRKYTDDIMWLSWGTKPIDPFSDNIQKKVTKSWDPDDSTSSSYVIQRGNSWTLLKLERGFLYFLSINH